MLEEWGGRKGAGMENSIRSWVFWDAVLESLWVLMLPGGRENNCICIFEVCGKCLQEHCWYLENSILKLMSLFFIPRLNRVFSEVFVYSLGGVTLTQNYTLKIYLFICVASSHWARQKVLGSWEDEISSRFGELLLATESPLKCWEYIQLFEKCSSSKSYWSFHKFTKEKEGSWGVLCGMWEESSIINKNESFYKAVYLQKVKRDWPVGRRKEGELCEQKLQLIATLRITAWQNFIEICPAWFGKDILLFKIIIINVLLQLYRTL